MVKSVNHTTSEISSFAYNRTSIKSNKHHIKPKCLCFLTGLRGSINTNYFSRIVQQFDQSAALNLFVVEEILLPKKPAHGSEVVLSVIFQFEALLRRSKPKPIPNEQPEHGVLINIITINIIFILRASSSAQPSFPNVTSAHECDLTHKLSCLLAVKTKFLSSHQIISLFFIFACSTSPQQDPSFAAISERLQAPC